MVVRFIIPANMVLEIVMSSIGFFVRTNSKDADNTQDKDIQYADSLYRFTAMIYLVASFVWFRFYLTHPKSSTNKARIARGMQAIFLAFVGMWTIMNASRKSCGGGNDQYCEYYEYRIIGGAVAIIDAMMYTLRPNDAPPPAPSFPRSTYVMPRIENGREVYVIANVHALQIDTSPPSYDEVAPPDYATAVTTAANDGATENRH